MNKVLYQNHSSKSQNGNKLPGNSAATWELWPYVLGILQEAMMKTV